MKNWLISYMFTNYQSRIYWFKNYMVVSWLDQSKEYQELLGNQLLIVNCLLEKTVQEQLCYVVTKSDIYLQSALCDSSFFLK